MLWLRTQLLIILDLIERKKLLIFRLNSFCIRNYLRNWNIQVCLFFQISEHTVQYQYHAVQYQYHAVQYQYHALQYQYHAVQYSLGSVGFSGPLKLGSMTMKLFHPLTNQRPTFTRWPIRALPLPHYLCRVIRVVLHPPSWAITFNPHLHWSLGAYSI